MSERVKQEEAPVVGTVELSVHDTQDRVYLTHACMEGEGEIDGHKLMLTVVTGAGSGNAMVWIAEEGRETARYMIKMSAICTAIAEAHVAGWPAKARGES